MGTEHSITYKCSILGCLSEVIYYQQGKLLIAISRAIILS